MTMGQSMTSPIHRLHQSRWIKGLIYDCGQIEIRHEVNKNFTAGIFTSPEIILELIDKNRSGNLYSTINQFSERRLTNSIFQRTGLVGNADVTSIRRLMFDFDPVREKGIPATNSQVEDAKARAREFNRDMKARGWASPAICMSGNGSHLMYRCNLTAGPELVKYLKRLYTILAEHYSDPLVTFDKCVFNAGRITRLYGSVNRKGIATEYLPHRYSEIEIPSSYQNVSSGDLWEFMKSMGAHIKPSKKPPPLSGGSARGYGIKPQGTGDYKTLDIAGWCRAVGIYLGQHSPGQHIVKCPWSHDHSDSHSEAMVFENQGSYPGFNCFHDHCADQGLFQLIELLGGADDFCREEFSYKATG